MILTDYVSESHRRPLPFASLCALPGAVVTRDEARGVVAATWRGQYAGQQDVTIEENDAMLAASLRRNENG